MADIEALAARLEQAGPESQAELLREVGDFLLQGNWTVHGSFNHMLDCGAYLSAAEMLVPEGWTYEITHWVDGSSAVVCQYNPGDAPDGEGGAATSSYALAAASLRASIVGNRHAD